MNVRLSEICGNLSTTWYRPVPEHALKNELSLLQKSLKQINSPHANKLYTFIAEFHLSYVISKNLLVYMILLIIVLLINLFVHLFFCPSHSFFHC